MKIALCLHGYFDSLQDPTSLGINGYNYIKKHILDKGDVDVFIHSWDMENAAEIQELYKPAAYTFQHQIDFDDVAQALGVGELKWQARKPSVVLSHFYSIQQAFTLWRSYDDDQYDVVIKSRFDLGQINRNTSGPGRGNPYPVQCINFNPGLDMSKLYMAQWEMMDQGPPDMWFYSNPTNMRQFCGIYNSVYGYLNCDTLKSDYIKFHLENTNEVEISNSVRLYKWWLEKGGLWERSIGLPTEWE